MSRLLFCHIFHKKTVFVSCQKALLSICLFVHLTSRDAGLETRVFSMFSVHHIAFDNEITVLLFDGMTSHSYSVLTRWAQVMILRKVDSTNWYIELLSIQYLQTQPARQDASKIGLAQVFHFCICTNFTLLFVWLHY